MAASPVCAVVDNESAYVNFFEDAFHDSEVQRGLEKMFCLESLALPSEETFSDYNQYKINQVNDSVSHKTRQYYVKLRWHKDILSNIFQTNVYVLPTDIGKAFLIIRIPSEADKNRFCFFLFFFLRKE